MITIGTLLSILLTVVIYGLVLGLIWWGITIVMSLFNTPEPLVKFIRVVFAIFVVLVLISILLGGVALPVHLLR